MLLKFKPSLHASSMIFYAGPPQLALLVEFLSEILFAEGPHPSLLCLLNFWVNFSLLRPRMTKTPFKVSFFNVYFEGRISILVLIFMTRSVQHYKYFVHSLTLYGSFTFLPLIKTVGTVSILLSSVSFFCSSAFFQASLFLVLYCFLISDFC